MDDVDFLSHAAAEDATATVMILLPDATVTHIHNVSPFAILDKCPLLYHAFEFAAHGVRQASIEATSRAAVVSLLRCLYTGNYLADDQPSSLLSHAEAYKMGDDFDVPELQVAAYVNFTRDTEFSTSRPTPPSDLCQTIRFVYKHFVGQARQQHSLVDTLLNYCLSIFKYQGLGDRDDFRNLVFDIPAFQKDMCRTSMNRDFQDDGAVEVVRLPVCSPTPHSHDHLNKRALGDFQFELWQDSTDPTSIPQSDVESSPPKRRKSEGDDFFTVVHRPKDPEGMPTFSEDGVESVPSALSDLKPVATLSFTQKQEIVNRVADLNDADVTQAFHIVRIGCPHLANTGDDELVLDMNEISDDTLRELFRFVKSIGPVAIDENGTESSADEQDFTFVHRPKRNIETESPTLPMSTPSSPELLSLTSTNTASKPHGNSAAESESESEDDWALL